MDETTIAADSYQGKIEKVTDPARIAGLLTHLLDNRSLLSINVPGTEDSHNSAVLEVDIDRGWMIIDELSPKSGHKLLLKAGKFQAQTRLKGVDVGFTSEIESSGEKNGIAFYRIAIPTVLNYRQQRAHYRAKISVAKQVEVRLDLAKDEYLSGILNDISVGGIGIRFSGDSLPALERGKRIPRCQIHLPTGEDIFCRIEIRFTSIGVEGNYRLVGARFIQLSPAQEATVAKYVAFLDRQFIRQSPKI